MAIGTFGSFTQARLAIYAAQTGLTVTGNNISNVNTKGYTRQRLDQKSLYNAGADRYYSTTGVKVGQGVLCYGLSQLRDPYLDIQYRSKSTEVGALDTKLSGLEGIQQILDEVGKGGEIAEGKEFGVVAAALEKIYKALENLTDQTGHATYDVQVRAACQDLVKNLSAYARNLQSHYDNMVTRMEQDVNEVNTILTNIRNLNENIRQADIYGDDALEMRDERNLQIDKLSEYIKIDVSYTMEDIGSGAQVEKLIIRLGNANPDAAVHTDSATLIDGIYGSQLSIDPVLNEKAYKYLDANGKLTNDPDKAAQVPMKNPNEGLTAGDPGFDPNFPDGNFGFVQKNPDGSYTGVTDAADATLVPQENDKYEAAQEGLLYLKPDGTATSALAEAAHSPNFDITVSELTDRLGRILYNLKTFEEISSKDDPTVKDAYEAANGKATSVTDPATGVVTITTYRKEPSDDIKRNPNWIKNSTTAYQYLTSDGRGTNNPQEAGKIYQQNPNFGKKPGDDGFDPAYPESTRYLEVALDANGNPQVGADGKPVLTGKGTDDSAKAWIPKANANYKPEEISGYRYIKYDAFKNGAQAPGAGATVAEIQAYYTNNLDEARGEPTYYQQTYQKIPSTAVSLDDNDLFGRLQSQRELLTEDGEFSALDTINGVDEGAASKRGIPYYQKTLDLLANQFATAFNKVNQGYLTNSSGDLVTKVWNPTGGSTETGAVESAAITLPNGTDTYTLNTKDMLGPKEWDMTKVPDATKEWLVDNGYVKKDDDGNPITDDQGNEIPDVIAYLSDTHVMLDKTTGQPHLEDGKEVTVENGMFVGGNLFSNNGDTDDATNITATNISISASWQAGPLIVNSFICAPNSSAPASTDSTNILKNMTSLFYQKLPYHPDTVEYPDGGNVRHDAMFTGTFEEMWTNIQSTLGDDMKVTGTLLDNCYQSQVSLDASRDSVSAVDFNDEAMNLMMYAKSYNAACRLMTTIDSVLDKLINNTGMTT